MSDMEESVLEVLTAKFGQPIARMILGKLKEEWLAEEAEKTECNHANWRYIYDEPGAWSKCDICEKRNVVVGS